MLPPAPLMPGVMSKRFEDNMKPLIVYQSRTGNTRKIVDAISSTLNAEVLHAERVEPAALKNRSLVGFGSGIYWTKVDRKIYEAMSLLPHDCNTFVFITSGMGFPFMLRLYWYFIEGKSERLGMRLVGKWDCRGYDQHPISKWMGISKGRPDMTDIESAKLFAQRMKAYE